MSGTTYNHYRFGGQLGYRTDCSNRLYIRKRHLNTSQGRWLSRDPLAFAVSDYNFYWYAKNNPVNSFDPSGLLSDPIGSVKGTFPKICEATTRILAMGYTDHDIYGAIDSCVKQNAPGCSPVTQKLLNCVGSFACNADKNITVVCTDGPDCYQNDGKTPHACAYVTPAYPSPSASAGACARNPTGAFTLNICTKNIELCRPYSAGGLWLTGVIQHEILHCCGINHDPKATYNACNTVISCCILRKAGLIPKNSSCGKRTSI